MTGARHFYEFGPFRLDVTEHLLLREGDAVQVTPKVFDLLLALVEQSGHLVEKDKLMKRVWPDSFVEEANLSVNMSALRRALGEGPNDHQFIETVPRRGYRFVASVKEFSDVIPENPATPIFPEAPSTGVSPTIPTEKGTKSNGGREDQSSSFSVNRRSVLISGAALLVIASTVGAFFYFTRAPRAAIESIAVLPFVNGTGNSDLEYLPDGLTDELITTLSRLPGLSVKARSLVLRYKDKDAPLQQIGKELNVQAILSGNVTQHGNDLTLHIELVDVATETALWSGDYKRSMTNLVALEGEISRDVASKLRLTLSGTEKQRLAKSYTANTEAYQLYLKGRYFVNKVGFSGELDRGIECFNKAIEIDPSYALAHAGLANAYVTQFRSGLLAPLVVMPKARTEALRAIALDESLAEAHVSLATVKTHYDWDWAGAEKEYRRAIELDPGYPEAHQWYGRYLLAMGRPGEAITELSHAEQLDPLSLFISLDLGEALFYSGQYDQAIKQCQKMGELDPNFPFTPFLAGRAYTQKTMYQEAFAVLNGGLSRRRTPGVLAILGYAYAVSGKRSEALKIIEELNEQGKHHYVNELHFALIYIGLGEKNQAFNWLDKAYESRPLRLIFLRIDPAYDGLRSDPRFADLLRKVGLPE